MPRLLQRERDRLAVARLDQRGIGRGSAVDGALARHRGRPPRAKPAAAAPESKSAWRRVSDVLDGHETTFTEVSSFEMCRMLRSPSGRCKRPEGFDALQSRDRRQNAAKRCQRYLAMPDRP